MNELFPPATPSNRLVAIQERFKRSFAPVILLQLSDTAGIVLNQDSYSLCNALTALSPFHPKVLIKAEDAPAYMLNEMHVRFMGAAQYIKQNSKDIMTDIETEFIKFSDSLYPDKLFKTDSFLSTSAPIDLQSRQLRRFVIDQITTKIAINYHETFAHPIIRVFVISSPSCKEEIDYKEDSFTNQLNEIINTSYSKPVPSSSSTSTSSILSTSSISSNVSSNSIASNVLSGLDMDIPVVVVLLYKTTPLQPVIDQITTAISKSKVYPLLLPTHNNHNNLLCNNELKTQWPELLSVCERIIRDEVIPSMEVNSIEIYKRTISHRKGIADNIVNATKKWFAGYSKVTSLATNYGGSTISAIEDIPLLGYDPSGLSMGYQLLSAEVQLRRLADMYLQLGSFQLANDCYLYLRKIHHRDKAWACWSSVIELSGVCKLFLEPDKLAFDQHWEQAYSNYAYKANLSISSYKTAMNYIECLLEFKEHTKALLFIEKIVVDINNDLISGILKQWASEITLFNDMGRYARRSSRLLLNSALSMNFAGAYKLAILSLENTYLGISNKKLYMAQELVLLFIIIIAAKINFPNSNTVNIKGKTEKVDLIKYKYFKTVEDFIQMITKSPILSCFLTSDFLLVLHEKAKYNDHQISPESYNTAITNFPIFLEKEFVIELDTYEKTKSADYNWSILENKLIGTFHPISSFSNKTVESSSEIQLSTRTISKTRPSSQSSSSMLTYVSENSTYPQCFAEEQMTIRYALKNPFPDTFIMYNIKLWFTTNISCDSIDSEVLDKIVLQKFEIKTIAHNLTPRHTGSLELLGISYEIIQSSHVYLFMPFKLNGRRVPCKKFLDPPIVIPDNRLHIVVKEPHPKLVVTTKEFSSQVMCGNLFILDLILENTGYSNVTMLSLVCSYQQQYILEVKVPKNEPAITYKITVPYTPVNIIKGTEQLLPGQKVLLKFTFHLLKVGTQQLNFIFGHMGNVAANVHKRDNCPTKLTYCTFSIGVLPSIHTMPVIFNKANGLANYYGSIAVTNLSDELTISEAELVCHSDKYSVSMPYSSTHASIAINKTYNLVFKVTYNQQKNGISTSTTTTRDDEYDDLKYKSIGVKESRLSLLSSGNPGMPEITSELLRFFLIDANPRTDNIYKSSSTNGPVYQLSKTYITKHNVNFTTNNEWALHVDHGNEIEFFLIFTCSNNVSNLTHHIGIKAVTIMNKKVIDIMPTFKSNEMELQNFADCFFTKQFNNTNNNIFYQFSIPTEVYIGGNNRRHQIIGKLDVLNPTNEPIKLSVYIKESNALTMNQTKSLLPCDYTQLDRICDTQSALTIELLFTVANVGAYTIPPIQLIWGPVKSDQERCRVYNIYNTDKLIIVNRE